MFDVGIETLFNVDTLRHAHDDDHPLFAALRNIPDDLVHPVLPRIFLSFVQCIRKHRSALFSQSSTQTSHSHRTGPRKQPFLLRLMSSPD
ncbi:hypothetical protein B0H10DRAFT_422773 [Mycena sp. CBHHK59/15]|nr:hypothetical protein B0H10DRAFT_422773 [Mycena sp. CBHHK59/15]